MIVTYKLVYTYTQEAPRPLQHGFILLFQCKDNNRLDGLNQLLTTRLDVKNYIEINLMHTFIKFCMIILRG